MFLCVAAWLAACSDRPGAGEPVALRTVPYDTLYPGASGQISIYNSRPGGGSVGMPVRFGDVDGDGNGDFIASPMLADSGPTGDRSDSGEIHVYYGNGTIAGTMVNTPQSPDITTLMGPRPGDLFGNEPDVEDVDGDGFADLVVGAQNYDGLRGDRPGCGGVFVYYGRPSRPRTVDLAGPVEGLLRISGAQPGDRLGIWVTTGDIDGDGARDLLLGADQADAPGGGRGDAGMIWILFGGQAFPPEIDLADPGLLRHAVIYGIDLGDHLGSTIHTADLDGDGDDDIVAAGGLARGSSQIGGSFMAGGDGPNNDRPDAGEVYVLLSPRPFPAVVDLATDLLDQRVTIYGAARSEVTGEELAIGDLDGDGRLDVAIGSLQASGPGGAQSLRGPTTGRTYLLFDAARQRGRAIDLAEVPDVPGVTTIYGARRGAISGDTLIVADMDEDGIDDLWDASPSQGHRDLDGTYRLNSGHLDVIFGQSTWPAVIDLLVPPDELRMARILGADANDMFAYGMGIGDADGDGHFDMVINAMAGDGFENSAPDAGDMYVVSNRVLFDTTATARAPLYLNRDIQPILEGTCLPCHAGEQAAAGLRLDDIRQAIPSLLGDDGSGRPSTQSGARIVQPGDPEASYLIEKLGGGLEGEPESPAVGTLMPPPPAAPLPRRVVADIRRWIAEGARAANEDLPPPPPPPAEPGRGFSTTFFTRIRMVLADPALGRLESVLIDPPAPMPLRLIGPQLTVPASEFPKVKIPGGTFGDIEVLIKDDGHGRLDRLTGGAHLTITLVQLAIEGTVETEVPVELTTGDAADGPFTSQGRPYDPIGGNLRLVGVGRIPATVQVIGNDPVLVELEGSVSPILPPVPHLADEIQPIFDHSCALANCHIGDGAAGLNLEAGRGARELIGVPSSLGAGTLVTRGDPAASFLLEKVAADRPSAGVRMPIGNPLDPLEIEAIRQWIAGGAPE